MPSLNVTSFIHVPGTVLGAGDTAKNKEGIYIAMVAKTAKRRVNKYIEEQWTVQEVQIKEENFILWWRTASGVGFESDGHWDFSGEAAFEQRGLTGAREQASHQQSQGTGILGIGNHECLRHEAEEGHVCSRTSWR